jgi:plastocyanin
VIGLSEHHRKLLISQANEKLSHIQMAFEPDNVSIPPGDTR